MLWMRVPTGAVDVRYGFSIVGRGWSRLGFLSWPRVWNVRACVPEFQVDRKNGREHGELNGESWKRTVLLGRGVSTPVGRSGEYRL